MKILYVSIIKSMMSKYFIYFSHLISMIVLARLFSPEYFGTLAAVMVFFTFFKMVCEGGFSPAIINLRAMSETQRDGIFTFTLLVGVICAVVLYFSADVIEDFYGFPGIVSIMPFIALSVFFSAASIFPNALLLRQVKFFTIGIIGAVSELLGLVLAVIIYKFVGPLEALAIRLLANTIFTSIALLYCSRNLEFGFPKPSKNMSGVSLILSFSSYQLLFNIANYFNRNIDTVIVGKFFGNGVLAIYDKSYEIMKYPLMLLSFAMTPAIQPVINKYSNDIKYVESVHRSFVLKLSLLASVAGFFIFSLSDTIILLLLGDEWLKAADIIRVLSLSIPIQVVLSTSGSFFQSLNKPNILLLSGVFSLIITCIAIACGIYARDIYIFCYFIVIGYHVNFIQAYLLLYYKVFKVNPMSFFINAIPALIFAPVTYLFFS